MKRQLSVVLVLLALVAIIGTAQAQDPVTISYVMWDANQLPPYQECAVKFQEANPGIVVDVLGRLLDCHHHRFRQWRVAGCLHRPPGEIP